MRSIAARLLLSALATIAALAPVPVQAAAGITITPASLRMELAKGEDDQAAEFTVTNQYASPVTLHFAVERSSALRVGGQQHVDPATFLSIDKSDLTLLPGQTAKQVVRARNSPGLAPGSQLADLVVTHQSGASRNISIAPAVRVPVTIIKLDGAVTSVGLTSWRAPAFSVSLPSHSTVKLRNTGNTIAIPRGYVSTQDHAGRVVARGTLNVASAAMSPGQTIQFETPLAAVGSARLPGIYKTYVTYGLGGDSGSQTVAASFLYVAWWHVLAAAVLLASLLYAARRLRRYLLGKAVRPQPHPPKRPMLIGRDIT